jgi:hypothetical protein
MSWTRPRDRWLVRAAAAAWLAVAFWRFLLAAGERGDRFGTARRLHPDLLALQGFCALVVAGAILGARDAAVSDEPRMARLFLGLIALGTVGFFLFFTHGDLTAFGGSEN